MKPRLPLAVLLLVLPSLPLRAEEDELVLPSDPPADEASAPALFHAGLPGAASPRDEAGATRRGPALAAAPEAAHWKIRLKYPAEIPAESQEGTPASSAPAPVPDQPTEIDIVQTGTRRRVTLSYEGLPPRQVDQDGPYILTANGGTIRIGVLQAGESPYPFYAAVFPFVDWVGQQDGAAFRNTVKYRGMTCLHYQSGADEAWIDSETLLPVAARHEGIEAYYKFLPAPTAPLAFPPAEELLIQKSARALKIAASLR